MHGIPTFYDFFYIPEAFSIKDAKKHGLFRRWGGGYRSPQINKIFDGKDRLIKSLSIDPSSVLDQEDHAPFQSIRLVLTNAFGYDKFKLATYEFDLSQYIQGFVYTNQKNPQKIKIGKLISRLPDDFEYGGLPKPEILKLFLNDPIRSTKKGSKFYVVISRHPYDIAGMSTDRNWTSCMNMGTKGINFKSQDSKSRGQNAWAVKGDIYQGSIVAYLTSEDDVKSASSGQKAALKRPLSRILLKPFENIENSGDVAYSIGTMYGANIPEFNNFIVDWVSRNLNVNVDPDAEYSLKSGLYFDGDKTIGFTGTRTSSIPIRVFREVLQSEFSHNEKYLHNFEIDVDQVEIQARIKVKFTFDKSEIEFERSSYSYSHPSDVRVAKLVDFAKKEISYERRSMWGSRGVNITEVNVDHVENSIVFEYLYFEESDGGNQLIKNEDLQEEYWEDIFESIGVDSFDYRTIKKELIKIWQSVDVDAIRKEEEKIAKDVMENRVLVHPDVKSFIALDQEKLKGEYENNLKWFADVFVKMFGKDYDANDPIVSRKISNDNFVDFYSKNKTEWSRRLDGLRGHSEMAHLAYNTARKIYFESPEIDKLRVFEYSKYFTNILADKIDFLYIKNNAAEKIRKDAGFTAHLRIYIYGAIRLLGDSGHNIEGVIDAFSEAMNFLRV